MELITTLAAIPAVLAVVNLLKQHFGLPTKWAALVAVVLGVGFSVADLHLGANATYQAASNGLLLGLAAAGFYDMTRAPKQIEATVTEPIEVTEAVEHERTWRFR